MKGSKEDYIKYRISRAWETYEAALLLGEHEKWNSAINRLYYAAYYAISALLASLELSTSTHNGVKVKFSEHFIKTKKLPLQFGKLYSQLFIWRQKGDYDDLFDFDRDRVKPYFEPVKTMITEIEVLLKKEI